MCWGLQSGNLHHCLGSSSTSSAPRLQVVYVDSLSGRFQDSSIARRLSVTVLYSALLAYQLAVAINLLACIMVLCAYFEVGAAGRCGWPGGGQAGPPGGLGSGHWQAGGRAGGFALDLEAWCGGPRQQLGAGRRREACRLGCRKGGVGEL